MADSFVLLNDGSSFVLLNDGSSKVLLLDAAAASVGLTISGTHAVPMIGKGLQLIPVEFTFLLKACILYKFQSITRIKCPIRVEVKSNIKLKSSLLVESRSPFEFKASLLLKSLSEKIEVLATLPILNAVANILATREQKKSREYWDSVQEAEKAKLRRSLLSKLFDELNDDDE